MKHFVYKVALTAGVLGLLASSSLAGPIVTATLSGPYPATRTSSLPNQDTALVLSFTLSSLSNLTIFTTSYATGGFEPNLMLYNSVGKYITTGVTPGSSPVAQKDPSTNQALDAYLTASNLSAGTYSVSLTDFLLNQSLTATNLSDGFTVNYGSGTTFADQTGSLRTGNYSITVNAVSPAAVPEPATVWLTGCVLAAVGLRATKRLS